MDGKGGRLVDARRDGLLDRAADPVLRAEERDELAGLRLEEEVYRARTVGRQARMVRDQADALTCQGREALAAQDVDPVEHLGREVGGRSVRKRNGKKDRECARERGHRELAAAIIHCPSGPDDIIQTPWKTPSWKR